MDVDLIDDLFLPPRFQKGGNVRLTCEVRSGGVTRFSGLRFLMAE